MDSRCLEECLQMQGHQLEDAVKSEILQFQKFQRTGELLKHVVDPVIRDLPGKTPVERKTRVIVGDKAVIQSLGQFSALSGAKPLKYFFQT